MLPQPRVYELTHVEGYWRLLGYSVFDKIANETAVAALTRAIVFLEAKGYDVRSFAPWPNSADPQHPTFLLHVRPPA